MWREPPGLPRRDSSRRKFGTVCGRANRANGPALTRLAPSVAAGTESVVTWMFGEQC